MKKYFLAIFLLGLVFSIYSVSALYQGTIGVAVGNNTASVTVGNIPSVNVTDSSANTSTGATTDSETTGGGGGSGGSSLLSTVLKTAYNDSENETKNSNPPEEENSKEQITSTNFLTGFAVGVSDFAKSPAGVATFILLGLTVVGGITFLAVKGKFKNFLPKKKENNIAEQ